MLEAQTSKTDEVHDESLLQDEEKEGNPFSSAYAWVSDKANKAKAWVADKANKAKAAVTCTPTTTTITPHDPKGFVLKYLHKVKCRSRVNPRGWRYGRKYTDPHVDLGRFLAFAVLAHESDLWVVRNFCDGDFSAGFDMGGFSGPRVPYSRGLPIYDLADDLDSKLGPNTGSAAVLAYIHEVLRLRAMEGDDRGTESTRPSAGKSSVHSVASVLQEQDASIYSPPLQMNNTWSSSVLQETTSKDDAKEIDCENPKKRFRFRVLTDFDDTAMPPHSSVSGTELWAGDGDETKAPQGSHGRHRYYGFHKLLEEFRGGKGPT